MTLLFKTLQLASCSLELCLSKTSLFLSRLKFLAECFKLRLKITSLLGMAFRFGSKHGIAFAEDVELVDPFHKLGMLGS